MLNSTGNESIKHEVTSRLARVQIANNKADQALVLLSKGEQGAFAPVYNELKGDAYASQNKPDEARQAYTQAIAELQGSSGDTSILSLKIDALGKD